MLRSRLASLHGVKATGTARDMRDEMLSAGHPQKPTVSTALGLDFVDGEEIILAHELKLFTRAVADLLADPSRRKALGEAARRQVELQYRLPVLRAALRVAMKNVVDRPRELHRDFIAHGLPS